MMIKRRTSTIVIFTLLSVIAVVGSYLICGRSLHWEKVADHLFPPPDNMYKDSAPTIRVAAKFDEVDNIEHVRDYHLRAVEGIDFNAHVVVAIYMGNRGTADKWIEVSSVRLRGDTVVIRAKFSSVPRSFPSMPTESSPYYILKIEKMAKLGGTMVFSLVVDHKKVAETTHFVPPTFTSPLTPQ